jgi:hypothetical protein
MTVVTAHQPNFLPGASVVTKLQAADAVILLDEVQWSKNGWSNRNRLPDGRWVTVPVAHSSSFAPINRVRIGEPKSDWRERVCHDLRTAWPGDVTEQVCREIQRPYRLLVGLNVALLRIALDAVFCETLWAFQSHLDGGHAVVAQSDDADELAPISERLAMMVEELGGTTYLSGPSGSNYLDEEPFVRRGIDVAYWSYDGANQCVLGMVNQRREVAA